MQGKWTRRALLAPATLWFLGLLVLPLVVVVVFSFGERAPAGGYAPGFSFEQYANLPSRWTAFRNTLILAPLGTLAALLAGYPLAYLSGAARRPAVPDHAPDPRDRALLGLDPDPHLRLDVPARRTRPAGAARISSASMTSG